MLTTVILSTYGQNWPEEHNVELSNTWPNDHNYNTSKTWGFEHIERGVIWPANHSGSISVTWPREHSTALSNTWGSNHDYLFSESWPPSHSSNMSKTWPDTHRIGESLKWPPDHKKSASETWPAPHYEDISEKWPRDHEWRSSSTWGEDHQKEVSKKWPPGHLNEQSLGSKSGTSGTEVPSTTPQISTDVSGAIQMNTDQLIPAPYQPQTLEISGIIDGYVRGTDIVLEIYRDEGELQFGPNHCYTTSSYISSGEGCPLNYRVILATKEGYFNTEIIVDETWQKGNYKIILKYGDSEIETKKFVVRGSIPTWIKNNAEWWAQGLISDKDFVAGIGYMVKEKIIQVDNVEFDSQGNIAVDDNVQVPKWIRNNAEWWSEGKISDDDFKSGIQFMVKEKIIDFKERKEIPRTQTAKTVGELDLSSEERHKAVTAASTIVVAEENMLHWLLEAENYALKQLDDKIDEAWQTFDETRDKNDMNRAVALQDHLDDVESLSKTTLTALKDATQRKEDFFLKAQESGFDKFRLETDANSKLSTAEVSSVKSDKDFENTIDSAKDSEKTLKEAWKELDVILQLDLPFNENGFWNTICSYKASVGSGRENLHLGLPLGAKISEEGLTSSCDILTWYDDMKLVGFLDSDEMVETLDRGIQFDPDVDETIEFLPEGTDTGGGYGFYPQEVYVSFTHNIGESPCPQHIVFIEIPTWSGTWQIASKPSWADVDIKIGTHIAVIEFNCQLDAYVTQTLSGTVTINAKYEDGRTEEYTVSIKGQINAG